MSRIFLLWSVFVFVAIVDASVFGQNRDVENIPLPSTISEEARAYLESLPSWKERLDDAKPLETTEEWEAAQKQSEERFKELNGQVLKKFIDREEAVGLNGIDVYVITPKDYDEKNDSKALLYVHGGAYVYGSPEGAVFLSAPIAAYTGLKVYAIRYRLAPQHPFPAGLDDCVTVYREMLKRCEPENIGVFGHSAGGSLCVSMLLKARDEYQCPMPAAVASITPWSDLAKVGESYFTLEGISPVLHYDMLDAAAKAYAGGTRMDDPLVSPLYADYTKGFAPTFIQTGTRDLFLSNCVRLHQVMKRASVNAELSVHEGMWHGFQGIPNPFFKEAIDGNKETAAYLKKHLKLD